MKGISYGFASRIHVGRWTCALALACFSLIPSLSIAESPVTQYAYPPYADPDAWRSNGQAACVDFQSYNNSLTCPGGANAKITSVSFNGVAACSYTYTQCNGSPGGSYGTGNVITNRSWCPLADAAPVGGVCGPPVEQVTCPAAGTAAGSKRRDTPIAQYAGSLSDWWTCEARTQTKGCLVKVAADFAVRNGAVMSEIGPGTFTGASCDMDAGGTGTSADPAIQPGGPATRPVAPGQAAPEPCARGSFTGTVNGVDVCIKPSNSDTVAGTTPGTTTTTDSSGTSTEVKTEQQTTCSGTRCTVTTTTTTTVRNSAGVQQSQTTTTGSENQDREVYCTKNPGLTACGGSGAGGSGDSESDCKGDTTSVRCGKGDTPSETTPKKGFSVTYSADNILGTGGGSCPADKYTSVNGRQLMVWNWTKTCDLLTTYVKPLLITLATVMAFFILSPGKMA